jgi:hypothetical protein
MRGNLRRRMPSGLRLFSATRNAEKLFVGRRLYYFHAAFPDYFSP